MLNPLYTMHYTLTLVICLLFSSLASFAQDSAPSNDEPTTAEVLPDDPALDCIVGIVGTTRGATGSDMPVDTCGGMADDDVFYRFTASYSDYRFSLRALAGNDSTNVVQVVSKDSGKSFCSTLKPENDVYSFQLSELTEGAEFEIRIYTAGEATYFDFEFCITRLDYRVAQATDCVEAPTATFDGTGVRNDFYPIRTSTGIVAAIENTQNLGKVDVSVRVHEGPMRTAGNNEAAYFNRSISIVPEFQPADSVYVRLYFEEADLQDWLGSQTSPDLGDLSMAKVSGSVCSPEFPGGGEEVQIRNWYTHGDRGNVYLEVSVASFSEFFAYPTEEQLITTSIQENGTAALRWGIGPNPVSDRLTLTAPDELTASSVTAEVFDFTGKRIQTTLLPAGKQRFLDTYDWPRGMYVVVLSADGQRTSARVVK